MKPPTDVISHVEMPVPEFFSFDRCVEAPSYALRDLVFCEACEAVWTPRPHGPSGSPGYACSNPQCSRLPLRCDQLEALVAHAVEGWLGSPDAVAALEPSLRRRLRGFADPHAPPWVSPADAPWMLGVAQDFRRFWHHVVPESQRKLLVVLVHRIVVGPEGVQIQLAVERPAASLQAPSADERA